jgi:hypothetical protein
MVFSWTAIPRLRSGMTKGGGVPLPSSAATPVDSSAPYAWRVSAREPATYFSNDCVHCREFCRALMVLLVISSCASNLRVKAAQLEVGLGHILHQGDPRRPLGPLAGQPRCLIISQGAHRAGADPITQRGPQRVLPHGSGKVCRVPSVSGRHLFQGTTLSTLLPYARVAAHVKTRDYQQSGPVYRVEEHVGKPRKSARRAFLKTAGN